MDRRDLLLSLMQDLLAAPGSEHGWHTFLSHFCQAFDGSGANFIAVDFTSKAGNVSLTARTAPEAIALYQQHWHVLDPWAHHHSISGTSAGTAVLGEQLVTRPEMRRTAFYNDFGRHYDVFQCMVGLIESSPEAVAGLSVNRSERHPSFDATHSALLTHLISPVRRALQIHRRLAGAELMALNAAQVFDRLPHGVLFLSVRGIVLSTNKTADEILRTRDGLTVDRAELRASTVPLTQQLRSVIAKAVQAGQGAELDLGRTALKLPRPSGRRPLTIVIAPLPSRAATFMPNPAAAVMFVTDPERSPVPDVPILRTLFGLTESEAELVRCLISGLTLEQAAGRFGLRIDTVRKRLKSVFEKTDTHRQADLVALVLNSVSST